MTSTCHVVALHNTYRYLHSEYDYGTNSIQRSSGESSKLMVYFSRALQPGAIQKVLKFLTLPVKQMHHPMKGHNGIDRRIIIYFLSRKIMRRYS